MEKMPFSNQIDERATTMIRTNMTMSTSRQTTTTTVTTSDWKDGLPVITGSTFTLREMRVEDAPSLLAMLTTEEVSRFISPPPTTVEGFERFIMWAQRERQAGNYACFAVVPQGCTTAVGIFQLKSLEQRLRAPPNGASRWARSSGARASSLKAPASSWTSRWT